MTKIMAIGAPSENLWRIGLLSFAAIAGLLIGSLFSPGKAEAAITSQLDFGSRGSQVSELQQFLASNRDIYPAGIVSGYFGPLTRAAVIQFQANYDIEQVGRVGPITMARINAVMASGLGLDVYVPRIQNIVVQPSRTGATISWTTGELARGKVNYSSQLLAVSEAGRAFTEASVGGSVASSGSDLRMSQSVSLQGLAPGTTYYYVIQATDASGNVSMTMPAIFRTDA